MRFATTAIHAGQEPNPQTGAVTPPIYMTSTYSQKAQAEYVDVFSIMPYHARFGHAAEPEWISRQVAWLGE